MTQVTIEPNRGPFRTMLQLAWPVVITYLGFMTMSLVDLIVVGRVSAVAIGAVGVGSSVFSWVMTMGLGLLTGMDYPIAHAFGARDTKSGHQTFVQSLILSLIIGLPLTVVMLFVSEHLAWFGINAEIIPETEEYLWYVSLSLFPVLVFSSCRQYLQAISIVRPAMIILIFANVLNAILDYMLVLGKWGSPAYGTVGSAWATLISRVVMVFMMFYFVWDMDRTRDRWISRIGFKYNREKLRELLRLGIPASLQMGFEVGIFALSTGLAAKLTLPELAAHQIVLTTASITFMVPFGLGAATSVLVGQALGRKDTADARRMGWMGIKIGAAFMALSAVMMFLFPRLILRLYTNEVDVIAVGQSLLFIAGFFQLFDGLQAVGTGALRGVGDTKTSMYLNFVGHWLIGLPLGVLLAFQLKYGAVGLWIGLSTGLLVVASGLVVMWNIRSRGLESRTS